MRVIVLKIFLKTDSRTIGLRFEIGPGGLPGFGRRIKLPALMSRSSWSSKQMLKMLAICGETIVDVAFRYSAGIFSGPDALFEFSLLIPWVTSAGGMGFVSADEGVENGSMLFCPLYFSEK